MFDPLDALLQHEYVQGLRKALLDLPPINRQALIMHQWGHYTYPEISERPGPATQYGGRAHQPGAQATPSPTRST